MHHFDQKIEFLGHDIFEYKLNPLTKNIKAITNFDRSKTPKQVRSFLGLCSYYRRLEKNFSRIANPLFKLIKHDKVKLVKWDIDQEKAFNKLKQFLTSESVIEYFSDDKNIFLFLSLYSITGLKAVIEQLVVDNKLLSI